MDRQAARRDSGVSYRMFVLYASLFDSQSGGKKISDDEAEFFAEVKQRMRY